MSEKICVLTQDPEQFHPGIWSLHYDCYYTSVDKIRCGEVDSLKKGDKIIVTTMDQRVIHVRRYVDPLGELYVLREEVGLNE